MTTPSPTLANNLYTKGSNMDGGVHIITMKETLENIIS
jgi:hypothetical protein